MQHKKNYSEKTIAYNRKAYHNFYIKKEIEAGIILTGQEVKSLRQYTINIEAAYVKNIQKELYLVNANIKEYKNSNKTTYKPTKPRKLLLHKQQIKKFIELIKLYNMTIIPLIVYFNIKNIAKILLGIAKGKKKYDKRQTIKKREWRIKQNLDLKKNIIF